MMSVKRIAGLAVFSALALAAGGIAAGSWPVEVAASAASGSPETFSAQSTGRDEGKRVRFAETSFDPLAKSLGSAAAYRTAADGKGLRFVQFNDKVRGEWLADLAARGMRPLQYYPDDTYLVWGDGSSARAIEALAQVRWQGEYRPEWKLQPDLHARRGVIRNVGVHFFNDGDVPAVLAAMATTGARVVNHGPAQSDHAFFDAWVEIDAGQLPELAALPQVVWLEFADPIPLFDDEMSSQIVAGNYTPALVPQTGYLAWLGGLGFNGNGVTWSVIDSGVDLTHPDFAGRIAGGFTYAGCPAGNGPGDDTATGGHGTHVAGIIAGNGAAGFGDAQNFLYGVGMAPGARIFAQNPICAAGTSWPPSGGWQVLSKNALIGGAVGGNGSWTSGEGSGTTYTAGARVWDQIARDGNFDTSAHEPFIMVFSAGNSGPNPGTLTSPKAAKNAIITGGTQNFRVSSNINAVYNASSRGPTQDGRFGVTIAAPAQSIASARRVAAASQCSTAIAGTNNNYAFCTGTSMAAPHASGVAVLLTEWWRSFNAGANPSPAMIKALLMNGAIDYGGGGSIPNTTQGWGRIDVRGSMGLNFARSRYIDQTDVLTAVGQSYEVSYSVGNTAQPLKISMAWTDAAAAAGANPVLVNDLDLVVITGGQTYLGNVFASGVSTTGGTADIRNNVENVFVANPGRDVTIRVIARNLPGDGIPGNASLTDQDFALACRNCGRQAVVLPELIFANGFQ